MTFMGSKNIPLPKTAPSGFEAFKEALWRSAGGRGHKLNTPESATFTLKGGRFSHFCPPRCGRRCLEARVLPALQGDLLAQVLLLRPRTIPISVPAKMGERRVDFSLQQGRRVWGPLDAQSPATNLAPLNSEALQHRGAKKKLIPKNVVLPWP